MSYLLDTCVISELVKKQPNPGVVGWLDTREQDALYVSVLTFGELHKGISKLPESVKKDTLSYWITHDLVARFEGHTLALSIEVAATWGALQGEAERRGEKLPIVDSLIAATASVHHLIVVTRNVQDLRRCHAQVINPWEPTP